MVAMIYPDPAAVQLLAEDEHLVKVPSTFAFGNQLQYELRSHYAPSSPLAEVDAQATSVASMAAVLSVDRATRSADVALLLCRATLLDFVEVSMHIDEALDHSYRLLGDTRPKPEQLRWAERWHQKASILVNAFNDAIRFVDKPAEQQEENVRDAFARAGIRDLPQVLRLSLQAHRRVVFLARELRNVDRGAWRALYAMVAPFLTPKAQDDINIVTGRASQPH
jgi:hypothetical protein